MAGNSLIVIPNLKEKPHVTAEEAKNIWLQASKPEVRMLIKTLWYTGLRITEALTLTKADLKRNGFDYSLQVWTEKVGKKKDLSKPDILPIPRDFALDLQDYINQHVKGNQLFPMHRTTAWRQVKNCARLANLTNWKAIRPHFFRHGFVYDKASKGVHPYVLSKLARHQELKTTMGYYQPSDNDLREAMER